MLVKPLSSCTPSHRHCDGVLSAIIDKLKGIYQSIKARFDGFTPLGKILKLIGKALKLFGAINFSRKVPEFIRTYRELTQVKIELVNTTKEYDEMVEEARRNGFPIITGKDVDVFQNGQIDGKKINKFNMDLLRDHVLTHAAVNAVAVGIGVIFDMAGSVMRKYGFKRKDSSCGFMIRYNDDIFGYAINKLGKAINAAREIFSSLPIGRKILYILGKALKILSAASLSIDTATLFALKMQMIKFHAIVNGAIGLTSNLIPTRPLRFVAKSLVFDPIRNFANGAVDRFSGGASKPVINRMVLSALAFGIGVISEKIATLKKKEQI